MSKIREILHHDLRSARKNVITMIVLFGLTVVPLVFTVFNVLASWNPFDNTDELKIAVSSEDEGHNTDLAQVNLNLGEQVLAQLSLNKQIDWTITTKENALEGTRSGEYYASIVLPPSFSKDLMTFYIAGTEPTELTMYTNQKKNSLAPMITEQAATGAIDQINESFSEVVNNVGLGLVTDLNKVLTDGDTKAVLNRMESSVDGVARQLRQGSNSVSSLSSLVESTIPLAQSAERITESAGAQMDALNLSGTGGSGGSGGASGAGDEALANLGRTFADAASSLSESLQATSDSYNAVGNSIDRVFGRANSSPEASANELDRMADRFDAQLRGLNDLRNTLETRVAPALPITAKPAYQRVLSNIDESIARATELRDTFRRSAKDLRSGKTDMEQARKDSKSAIAKAVEAVDKARNSYANDLQPQLAKLGDSVQQLSQSVQGVKADLRRAKGTLGDASLADSLGSMQAATAELSEKLNQRAGDADKLAKEIKRAGETGDLSRLARMIGNDPSLLAQHMANPTAVKREPLNEVNSFGTGMTPLYASLALWVGALITSVVVHTRISERGEETEEALDPERYSRAQAYLGRFGIFALIGTVQSLLMAAGLIFFVGIEPAHPLLFTLACWLSSMVFMLVVYTLVISFGNAGKALGVLLLVFQVSGAGGAYPLELLPGWFQSMSPFLPATYAIRAFRSSIAGTYQGDYWLDILGLLVFILPALLLGLVLRKGLDGYNRRMDEGIAESKVLA
ncbi:YhgE/Pip domain-containing protein [Corynebacterium sp. UMB4614]|uniref:YhgE/Pip domain-containing protein n=1 Tax=Corynebacterium sp. UMB4614 TaxID=3046334 RepID=UPI00254C42A0|nr:YhgE/Pip domain-containing protein [Corynebacterium sp. UMB4614]MDK7135693.1 YhgE/Pip domain-containing protein [Corynebacterium sp. UMB4614]